MPKATSNPDTEAGPRRDELQVGARLKHARLLEGIRIRELAERVGCAESMISKIENGKVAPSLAMLQRLVEALNREFGNGAKQALRDARANGTDPAAAKRQEAREQQLQQAKAKTFEACATEFIEFSKPAWKNAKHAQQWTNTLTQYAYPVIGQCAIGDVDSDHIVEILSPIWQSKTETATRLRGRIEAVLDWATVKGWRKGDNPARLKGHMEYLLPKVRIGTKNHHASLPYEELPSFMAKLQGESGMARYALEFLILCASRTGEVVGARWDEIDLAKAIWTIPGERMKAGKEHRVPLGKRALEILATVKPFSGKQFIFITGKKDVAMSTMAMSMLLRRIDHGDVTVHGMRSTFRTWAGERSGYPFEVCEHALAHRLSDAVAAAYLRSDFFAKRTLLMADWEKYCFSACTQD